MHRVSGSGEQHFRCYVMSDLVMKRNNVLRSPVLCGTGFKRFCHTSALCSLKCAFSVKTPWGLAGRVASHIEASFSITIL